MDRLIVNGGKKLEGEVSIKSAKNSVLPLIACSIMTSETVVIKNCPKISDVFNMIEIIRNLGGYADFVGDDIVIDCKEANPVAIDSSLTKSMRSSVFVLGPILSRFKKASVSYPGGCDIGARPIDLHINGLGDMGVKIIRDESEIRCDADKIKGGTIKLRFPSVGATENLMMAGVLSDGETRIINPAREPEIVDLQNFINAIGGKVYGAGSGIITVTGVKKLGGTEYTPIPDRITAGTFAAAVCMCGGKVFLKNAEKNHMAAIIRLIEGCGGDFIWHTNGFDIIMSDIIRPCGFLSTSPYPGFPTDMQSQTVALLSIAAGESIIEENIFESRFRYIDGLNKMGAKIFYKGNKAYITGVRSLHGAEVYATDLRGGAALLSAALSAEGQSVLYGVSHIDRGYEQIERIFTALGGEVKREKY